MQRVHRPLRGHRLRARRERLPEHLPAEDRAPAEILALAAEEVAVEALEGEQFDQIGEQAVHGVSPAPAPEG